MIAIVGAGAAGLATAIFAARRGAREAIVLFDGAIRPGAKILVSGGARCNVTNAVVTEADYGGSAPHLVRRVLRGFGVAETVAFFREIGVALHEEQDGKLFPDADRSRVVLRALLAEAERLGVVLRAGERVASVEAHGEGFRLHTARGSTEARKLVLATGGLSLPKTGSDGAGPASCRGLRPLDRADDASARAAGPGRLVPRSAFGRVARGHADRARERPCAHATNGVAALDALRRQRARRARRLARLAAGAARGTCADPRGEPGAVAGLRGRRAGAARCSRGGIRTCRSSRALGRWLPSAVADGSRASTASIPRPRSGACDATSGAPA